MAGPCQSCAERAWFLERNIVVAQYSGVMRELFHNLKFNNVRSLYRHCIDHAHRRLDAAGLSLSAVTAIPMNRRKRWTRGYNQSELIARELARRIRVPYLRLLRETPGAGTQREMGYRDRFLNALDRYRVIDPEAVCGHRILVVDDIFTTGATLNEAARQLRKAGAREVFSLTIARAGIK